jgi:hypothetical protein
VILKFRFMKETMNSVMKHKQNGLEGRQSLLSGVTSKREVSQAHTS